MRSSYLKPRVATSDAHRCKSSLGMALEDVGLIATSVQRELRCAYEPRHEGHHVDETGRFTWLGGVPR
jgi:hypothetical protein